MFSIEKSTKHDCTAIVAPLKGASLNDEGLEEDINRKDDFLGPIDDIEYNLDTSHLDVEDNYNPREIQLLERDEPPRDKVLVDIESNDWETIDRLTSGLQNSDEYELVETTDYEIETDREFQCNDAVDWVSYIAMR